jgi:hypothetical protein
MDDIDTHKHPALESPVLIAFSDHQDACLDATHQTNKSN